MGLIWVDIYDDPNGPVPIHLPHGRNVFLHGSLDLSRIDAPLILEQDVPLILIVDAGNARLLRTCLLYTSPSPRD